MNKNSKLNKIIITLCVIELILILFFLAYLLVYSLVVGGDSLIMSPTLYACVFFMLMIPIGMVFYYLALKNNKRNVYKFEREESVTSKKGKNPVKEVKYQRFSELIELDSSEMKKVASINYDLVISLEEFSNQFRNFCASQKNLFYSIDDIRSFIANLATSKIMILQGMSGTGKTSIALAFEDFIGNQTTVIAVQPMWKERSDLIGYFNEFTKKFNETPLLKELYRSNFSDQIFIIVLDELNIARIEYYFAEFLSLLEYPNENQRTLEITNDSWSRDPKLLENGRLKIKSNVYFVGTANNDESTFAISDKVYDRAMIINLNKKAEKFEKTMQNRVRISNSNFEKLVNDSVNNYKDLSKLTKWINDFNNLIVSYFNINFGNRMVNQLKKYVPVYVACGGKEEDAFDDFISKKILRKLEGKDALRISNSIIPFIEELNATFGKDSLHKSKAYLENFLIK